MKSKKKIKFLDAEGLGKKVLEGSVGYEGFFGIGMSSKYYSKENLDYYCKWASENLKKFILVIADDPEKYNIMGFKGSDSFSALIKARNIGGEKFRAMSKIAKKYNNVELIKWRELTSSRDYERILSLLHEEYERDEEFQKHIENSLWSNIRFKLEKLKLDLGEKLFGERFRTLVNYSIEEVAFIIFLSEFTPYKIKVGHKGERVYDNIVDRIYSRYYGNLYDRLKLKNNRGNIYLQIIEG